MKHTFITITFLALSISLFASSEFKYIQPLSVEEAPRDLFISKPEVPASENTETQESQKPEEQEILKLNKDSDGDGIIDKNDMCPDTSNKLIVNDVGCPQITTLDLKFPSREYAVNAKIIDNLRDFATFLKENKNYQVIIYGYTDSVGNAIKNKTLSQKRANAVKKGLISLGVSSTKLTAIGKGEENPIADNMYEEGREKNRRIEIELIE